MFDGHNCCNCQVLMGLLGDCDDDGYSDDNYLRNKNIRAQCGVVCLISIHYSQDNTTNAEMIV